MSSNARRSATRSGYRRSYGLSRYRRYVSRRVSKTAIGFVTVVPGEVATTLHVLLQAARSDSEHSLAIRPQCRTTADVRNKESKRAPQVGEGGKSLGSTGPRRWHRIPIH